MALPRDLGNLGDVTGGGNANANFDSGTLFIDSVNNRVGIANTTPDVALRVTGAAGVSSTISAGGNITTTSTEIIAGTGQNEEKRVRLQNASRNVYFFLNTGSLVGLWDNTSNTGRWTSDASGNFTAVGNVTAFSDENLKENIETINNALATVAALRGVRYKRKDTGEAGIGVIAQEVQQHVPEVVQVSEDMPLSVSYGNLVGLLIEAIKELNAKVEELENKVK